MPHGTTRINLERFKTYITVSRLARKDIADENQFLEFRTAARIGRLATVLCRCIADIEQQARVRLIGVLVRHPFVAEDSDLDVYKSSQYFPLDLLRVRKEESLP
jgi:hypothetical protein